MLVTGLEHLHMQHPAAAAATTTTVIPFLVSSSHLNIFKMLIL